MSFILDALRKSEHERQRQTGPALVEVAVAAPKTRTNVWATASIVLLVVNLAAIGVFLLTRSREEPAAEASAEPAANAPATDAPAGSARPAQPPPPAPAPQASVTQALPPAPVTRPQPMLQPAEALPPAAGRNPLAEEVSAGDDTLDYEVAAGAARPPAGPPAVVGAPTQRGSVVYQSLPEADPAAAYTPPAAPATANPAACRRSRHPGQ